MQGAGFSLSVFSANHIVKIGTSVDYGVCRGKRKVLFVLCMLVLLKLLMIHCRTCNPLYISITVYTLASTYFKLYFFQGFR